MFLDDTNDSQIYIVSPRLFPSSKLSSFLTSPPACFMGILNLTYSKLNMTVRYKQKK